MKTRKLFTLYIAIFSLILFTTAFGQIEKVEIKKPVVTQLGRSADLRPTILNYDIKVKDQGNRNTCSVFAVTFLLEYMTAKSTAKTGVDFSEEYLNYVTNKVKGQIDDGDFFENIAAGYRDYGIVNESVLPYKTAFDANYTPPDSILQSGKANRFLKLSMIRGNDGTWGLTDAHIDSMMKSLDAGVPISGGFKVTSDANLETKKFGNITMWYSIKNKEDFGGHSMPIVGYKSSPLIPGGGYFVVRNSGGSAWGDNGYGYVSFEYARNFIADVIIANTKSPLSGLILREPMLIKRSILPRPSPEILINSGKVFKF